MNPNILGIIGPGFLNQVPTLGCNVRFRAQGPGLNIKGAQGLGLETLNANPKPATPNTLNSSVYTEPLDP